MSIENKQEITENARAAAGDEAELRERIRAMVMQALVDRQADPAAIRDVMRDTIAGVGDGLFERGSQASTALREAVRGMDEAVGRSVYAVQMAVEEARGKGRRFADADVKEAVDAVKGLEGDLLSTLKEASDKTQGWLKGEFADLSLHLARTGTDTGAQVREVMEKLGSQMGGISAGALADSMAAMQEAQGRLATVASGILRGLADSLDATRK